MEDLRNDTAQNRYALTTEGGTAIADYLVSNGVMTFTHTLVPPALEGQGIASRLIKFALADAQDKQLKIMPQCSFVRTYIQRHPEWQDLLA